MKYGYVSRKLFIGPLVCGALALSSASASAAGCASFPDVSWWEGLSHARVAKHVEVKFGGNWTPYINQWESKLKKLKEILGKGNAVKVVKQGQVIRLKDDPLRGYIKDVEKRLDVMRCLGDLAKSGQAIGEESEMAPVTAPAPEAAREETPDSEAAPEETPESEAAPPSE